MKKKIRVFSVSVALILATWIRLDNIFLTIPVAFAASTFMVSGEVFYAVFL